MGKNVKQGQPIDWTVSLEGFKRYKTGHDRLKEVTSEVKSAIKRRGHEGIIMIVGPTRVGKTTLLRGVINSILLEKMSELEKDPGFLPAAWIEAYSYKRGYKWKDHWYGCLKALYEPLIEHKSAGYSIEPDKNARHAPSDYKYEQEDVLRRSFENAAKHRRTRVFGVDEAQSLVIGSPSNLHRSHVEVIKSVANTSEALHILCGNFDLLKLSNLSGQIGARSTKPIHFSRYHPNSKTSPPQAVGHSSGLLEEV
jgi:AAA domain